MPVHRIAKRSGTLLASAGSSPNTTGLVVDTANSNAITFSHDSTTVSIIPMEEFIVYNCDAVAATSRALQAFNASYQLTAVRVVWGVASSSGTVTVEKLTGTTAPGSGTALLTGTISTAATANTVTSGTLIATLSSLQFAAGDRIGLVFSGTETSLVGLSVAIYMKKL